MSHLGTSASRAPARAHRGSSVLKTLAVASLGLLALPLVPADAAQARKVGHHQRAGYAEAVRARAAVPTYEWTAGRKKPLIIFGREVDVP